MLGGRAPQEIDSWAVHAGGRSVLDAVEHGLELPAEALADSRDGARALRQHVLVHPAVRARRDARQARAPARHRPRVRPRPRRRGLPLRARAHDALSRAPALIVGGGPAGSAAAIGLARAGIDAQMLERSHAPQDMVCGGFLGWDALAALSSLGVDAHALGARPITRLRLVSAESEVEAALPQAAAGLSRRTLDARLARRGRGGRRERPAGRDGRARRTSARRCVRIDDGERAGGRLPC